MPKKLQPLPCYEPKSFLKSPGSGIDPEIIDVVFNYPGTNDLDEMLLHVAPADASLLRAVYIHAQKLRDNKTDPGDAFIEGVVRLLEATRRDQELKSSMIPPPALLPPAA